MAKIKIVEIFNSLQGEGRYVGVQSTFVRTFGCNFRCPAFGLDHNYDIKVNPEVAKIIEQIPKLKAEGKTIKDLPLVKSGCDSYVAVYPEFKDFSPMLTTDQVVQKIIDTNSQMFGVNKHLILTGGEPMLPGWQKAYPELLDKVQDKIVVDSHPFHVTIETNGTQPMVDSFQKYILENRQIKLHFSVSLKLKASGHTWDEAFQPLALESYLKSNPEFFDFKFVVDREEHMEQIVQLMENDLSQFSTSAVYLMPEGGVKEKYLQNKKKVADMAIKYGFRFSPRLQCELYDNAWST